MKETMIAQENLILLMLAAKAVDYTVITQQHGKLLCKKSPSDSKTFHWNPLEDDGDCSRLEVELGIFVTYGATLVNAMPSPDSDYEFPQYFVEYAGDKNAAKRKAVVWCASVVKNEPENDYIDESLSVGDLVMVCQHPSGNNYLYDETAGFKDAWVDRMNERVGSHFIVINISSRGVILDTVYSYTFPPAALKLIKKCNDSSK